jgi:hypothetical protein
MTKNTKQETQTTPATTPAEPKRELTIEELDAIMGGLGEDEAGAVGGAEGGDFVSGIRRC